jgi:hypothetical protein
MRRRIPDLGRRSGATPVAEAPQEARRRGRALPKCCRWSALAGGALFAEARRVRCAGNLLLVPAVGLLAIHATGCLASRQGGVVFPARYDFSSVTMGRTGSGTSGLHMAGALSWASLSPNPDNAVDVAVGYQLESYPVPERPEEPDLMAEDGKMAAVAAAADDPRRALHGPTLELGYRLRGTGHSRVWLSARGELLMQDVGGRPRSGVGGMLRLSGELFDSSEGSNHIGSIAIGPYLEVGARELPSGKVAAVALAGMSVRLPLAGIH